MNVIIYGAQGYALGAYNAIKALQPERKVLFFMVTSMEGNAPSLCGLDVRMAADVSEELSDEEKKNTEVLIATPANVHSQIEMLLERFGFTNHKRLTSQLWDDMMRHLYSLTGEFATLESVKPGDFAPPVSIYIARSHKDKPLSEPLELSPYMVPIQVGAANTNEMIVDFRDDEGVNISLKNGYYCELTGLYWVWKNVLSDCSDKGEDETYYGFAQYRRMLMLDDEDLLRLQKESVDVVLPYPLLYDPDINKHHERYISDSDWQAMLAAVRELQPEYAEAFEVILRQRYLYNYNVILARREVLRDYCNWLFPILEKTEELSVPKGCERSDRYIGYMGETLETLYFMKNAKHLKIVHTGCKLYV